MVFIKIVDILTMYHHKLFIVIARTNEPTFHDFSEEKNTDTDVLK